MTYKKEENYCSFFPDEINGVRYNYACYLHDRQYRNEVKVRQTRAEADALLRKGVFEEYKKSNKALTGFFISWIMYLGVRLFCRRYYVE